MSAGFTAEQLIQAAIEARRNAYAPYSGFLVGAAVCDEQGQIHSGCNVENASYGLTICAERVAICKAVSLGRRRLVAVAVATEGGHAPCGACRQFIAEFAQELPIYLVDAVTAEVSTVQIEELLPRRFDFS